MSEKSITIACEKDIVAFLFPFLFLFLFLPSTPALTPKRLLAWVWSAGFVHHIVYRPTRALVATPEEILHENCVDKC